MIQSQDQFQIVVYELEATGLTNHLELIFHPKCWLKLASIEMRPLGFEGSEDPDFQVIVRKKERQRIPMVTAEEK